MKAGNGKWQVAAALALAWVFAAQGARAAAPVNAGGDKVSLKLYGQIDRAFLWADDGDTSKLYFVDNKNQSTRFGLEGKATVENGLTFGGVLEMEVMSNISDGVSQIAESTGAATFKDRYEDVYVSGGFGKLSLGHGNTASNYCSEQDVSGTEMVAYSSIADLAGGIIFFDKTAKSLVAAKAVPASLDKDGKTVVAAKDAKYNPVVKDVFDNMDGLSRDDRIRYDSPVFAGLQLSGSYIERKAWDAALRYALDISGMKIRAAVAYADMGDSSKVTTDRESVKQTDGSLSVLMPFGLSITAAGGQKQLDDAARKNDPTFWYAKIGYTAQLFFPGATTFAVDYDQNKDLKADNDKATSMGACIVQRLDSYGTELFLAYRSYKLDRPGKDFADIGAVMGGARIKF